MDLLDLSGQAFRARLRRELPRWREEGLVDERGAAALEARYRLGDEGIGVATAAIYLLGALLVGGGVLSLVAWNWDALAPALKLLILFGALAACHIVGFRLWHVPGRLPRLGHALTFLGTLVLGAGIGLVAQIYHISTFRPHDALGVWAIGALCAGWALRSAPNIAVAVVTGFLWCTGEIDAGGRLVPFLPHLFAALFLPFAWRERSRLVFFLAAVGTVSAACTVAGELSGEGAAVTAVALAFAVLLLAFPVRFTGIARVVGFLLLVPTAYLLSFAELAEGARFVELGGKSLLWLAAALPAGAAGILFLFFFFRRTDPIGPLTRTALAGIPLLLLMMAFPDPALAIGANLCLLALAGAGIVNSVSTLRRGPFWGALLLGGTLIASRFFEFDTELWLKAIVFLVCGVAVILVGVAFERKVKEARSVA